MESPSTFRPDNRGFTPQQGASRGFTLIEIVIVFGMAALLMAVGLFMSMDVLRGTTYRSTRQVLISALTAARSRASANEAVPGNPSVTLSSAGGFFTCGSGTGIRFSQVSATTSDTGTVTVSEAGHPDATVSANSEGAIIW